MQIPPEGISLKIGRRRFLQASSVLAAAAALPASIIASSECAPTIPKGPSNGGSCPYPIPWLDKNGNHNQPAKANTEPSHIFHFRGKVGRCAGFTGMGTDNKGKRLPFGAGTTDYGYMAGEYWAARRAQQGIFAHT